MSSGPVRSIERIASLDVLRGFAVLGILIVNVQSYAMVEAAYFNPAANDSLNGAGLWVWVITHVFFDTKFISVFSVLFGAGMALMAERSAARGGRVGIHYRRQFWLLVIGLAHAHVIWFGDILVPYALCGFLLFGLRNLKPGRLIAAGFAMTLVPPLFYLLNALALPSMPAEVRDALAGDWAPPADVTAAEVATYQAGLFAQLPARSAVALEMETVVFAVFFLWRCGGLMLVGMGLYKLGVLSARSSGAVYRRMAWAGLGAGLPLVVLGVAYNLRHDFAFEHSMFQGQTFNQVGSLGVFLGYIGLVMLAVRNEWLPGLQRRLQAAGRMALTNYIGQSVLCTLIFYGHGLGQFAQIGRPGQVLIVVAIWIAQLFWSPWWLARYRFGPLEWLWRSLTYARFQPMRSTPG